jgi:hypothetical protein
MDFSKYKEFVHEVLFTFDFDISKKILPFSLGLILAVGTISLLKQTENLPVTIFNIGDSAFEELVLQSFEPNIVSNFSHIVSSTPQNLYNVFDEVSLFYAQGFHERYIKIGNVIRNEGAVIARNPVGYILSRLESVSLKEREFINNKISFVSNIFEFSRDSETATAFVGSLLKEDGGYAFKNISLNIYRGINSIFEIK